MKHILQWVAAFSLLIAGVALSASDLSEIIGTDPNAFFDIESESMIRSVPFRKGHFSNVFSWANKEKTAIIYLSSSGKAELTAFNNSVVEAKISFENGKISGITCLFYSRGDSGDISKAVFDSILGTLTDALNTLMKVKPVTRKEKMMKDGSVSQSVWVSGKTSCVLRWSSRGGHSNFKPEYINVRFEPFDASNDPRKGGYTTKAMKEISKGKDNLKGNVTKKEDGTTYIANIPTVVQGGKNYGVAAVMECLAKYYGNDDISQHDFANMTNVSTTEGIDFDNIREMLKKAGPKVGMKIRVEWSLFGLKDFYVLLRQYNKKAIKMKYNTIEPIKRGDLIYTDETREMMNQAVIAEVRKDDKKGFKAFKKIIRESIDDGIPVVWIGKPSWMPENKEKRSQGGGVYVLLITGYNDKTNEIIYTTTQGAGFEHKTISDIDAWIITLEYMVVEPR